MGQRGPKPKITIDQMGWVFEQLSEDVPLKALAVDLDVDVSTLTKWLNHAERQGFAAFDRQIHGVYRD